MKTLIIAALLVTSTSAMALRCGNDLVGEGDSVGRIYEKCDVSTSYQVQNENADIHHAFIKKNGMTYDVKIIDGKVYSIEGNRQ